MTDSPLSKPELRSRIRKLRKAEPDPRRSTQQIFERLRQQELWQSAKSILYHIGVRDEVPTLTEMAKDLQRAITIAAPFCIGDTLRAVRLESLSDLAEGAYGILEPRPELRITSVRRIDPSDFDIVLVPGLVFDRSGNRLGYGKGYYDRLLSECRPDCQFIAIAFDSQIVASVPSEPHDQPMDLIITPTETIHCSQ